MINFDSVTGQINTVGTGTSSAAAASTPARDPSEMGQKDFLTLMLAQLQAQDPLNPMDNGEFVAQLAQFSTVSGLEKINSSVESVTAGISDLRVASASTMLGRQVLVQGDVTRPDAAGGIHGAVDLAEDATSVVVTFANAETGEILQAIPYGAQPKGTMAFDWAEVPPDLTRLRAPIRVGVSVTTGAGTRTVDPQVYARVMSASSSGTDLTLQIEDHGAVNALEVTSIR